MEPSISSSTIKAIEAILSDAYAEGRRKLYEHEVYAILAELNIRTPVHILVRDRKDITKNVLSLFGTNRIVLKAVSRDLVHKHKYGGVRIVYKDLDFVRYSWEKMHDELVEKRFNLEGIILVEYVEYSKDLGNEILLGFREFESFGPVISFSKGGTDAEHFAENYSPPNLILAPIDRNWAVALLESTRIQKKYIQEGKIDYIPKIVEAGVKLSDLAVTFSNFFDTSTRFVFKELEVNPFVFDYDGNLIAIDGYARFDTKSEKPFTVYIPPKETMVPFFEPVGIAVAGISLEDETKAGNIIFRNLLRLGRRDVYGVNIKGGTVKINGTSFKLYKHVNEIPDSIDLAIIAVPAEATIHVLRECVEKKVKAIILIPGGFSEIKKNVEIEKEIEDLIARSGIRLMGPNCLGIIYASTKKSRGINTFFIPEEKFSIEVAKGKERNVAIFSQSGALGITEIYNLRHAIAPKVVVSYGNQLDVDPSDLAQYFEDDPMVDIMGFYIEGFKPGGGRRFFNIVSRSKKPIIVYKAGRTDAGRIAAQSHTASIAGEYEVAKAAMKQAGVVVADTMLDHGDFIKTFALLNDFDVRGNRIAIVVNAGYEKTYAADNLGELQIAELDRETLNQLEALLPPFVSAGPLLDLTAMATDELFESCIKVLLKSSGVDCLFVSIVPQAIVIHTTDREIDTYKQNVAARIVKIVHKYKKPTVVSVNVVSGSDAVYNRLGQVLDEGGVPTFLTAERAMVCLNEFIKYRLTHEKKDLSEWLRE